MNRSALYTIGDEDQDEARVHRCIDIYGHLGGVLKLKFVRPFGESAS